MGAARGRRGRPKGPTEKTKALLAYAVPAFMAGETLEQIGVHLGCTREWVRQALKLHAGLSAEDGGMAVRMKRRREEECSEQRWRASAALAERRASTRYGCSAATRAAIDAEAKALGRNCADIAYDYQMRSARQRGIVWELDLPTWWALWRASGHWRERGRGNGYVMCRVGDAGAYEIGNVFIATGGENSSWGGRKPLPPDEMADQRRRARRAAEAAHYYLPRPVSQTASAPHRISDSGGLTRV